MSPFSKEEIQRLLRYPLSEIVLPDPFADIFAETGAQTVGDVIRQMFNAGNGPDHDPDSHALHLDNRLAKGEPGQVIHVLSDQVGADLFELQPEDWNSYDSGWTEEFCRDGLNAILTDPEVKKAALSVRNLEHKDLFDFSTVPEFAPYDALDLFQQRSMCSNVSWAFERQYPILVNFPGRAWDADVMSYLYYQRYSLPYTLRMLQETEPELTEEVLLSRVRDTLGRVCGLGFALAFAKPFQSFADFLAFGNKPFNSEYDARTNFELTHPNWHVEVLKFLYPEDADQIKPSRLPFYDDWVNGVIYGLKTIYAPKLAVPFAILFCAENFKTSNICELASNLELPAWEVEGYVNTLLEKLRTPEIRELLLGGCPYGTSTEHFLFPLCVEPDKMPDMPVSLLRLPPDLMEVLHRAYRGDDMLGVAGLLNPEEEYRPFIIELIGERNFCLLYAYVYGLGIQSALNDAVESLTSGASRYTSMLGTIFAWGAGDDWVSDILSSGQTSLLVAANELRRVLMGYVPVPGYTATRENMLLLCGMLRYRLCEDAACRWAEKLGLDTGGKPYDYCKGLAQAIAAPLMEKVRAYQRGAIKKPMSVKGMDSTSQRLLDRLTR